MRSIASEGAAIAERTINEDHIRLAVTGLSRAGKTVFITSLVQNLAALGRNCNALPKLNDRLCSGGSNRLVGVDILPAGAGLLPFFDVDAKLHELAGENPTWPARTDDVAQISVNLELSRSSTVGRQLGSRRVRLDILDYPGEWLLDLSLLNQTYSEWSRSVLPMLRDKPRVDCFRDFLAFTTDLKADGPAEESLLHKGHMLYREALHRCRSEHGLRYLQPGRFICPGPVTDAPFMWFFPMATSADEPGTRSTAALLTERFKAYKQHIRSTFFDTHFINFNRQVVLVDVLGALHAGRAAYEDTARALRDIATVLRYGQQGVLRSITGSMASAVGQLLPSFAGRSTLTEAGQTAIDRVIFVATKADHVPNRQRDNLVHLLEAVASGSRARVEASVANVSFHVASSIHSTKDSKVTLGGRPVEAVEGRSLSDGRLNKVYVGDVPSRAPTEDFWSDVYFQMPVFRPPPIDPYGLSGIPHLNLDVVLDELIGDLL